MGAPSQSKTPVVDDAAKSRTALRRELSERKLAEERLRASEENLRALAAHLQAVRDEERARLWIEIHDELSQLSGLKIELTSLAEKLPQGQKPLVEKTASMLRLLDQTIQSVRKIATGLRPAVSDHLGLLAAIEWQANDFCRRSGVRCKLSLPPDAPVLAQERATAMFRVYQELLSNVSRHARATRVEIAARVESGMLTLVVEDNGKGLDKGSAFGGKSLGLLGMRERLRPFGGRIEIDGQRGKGTKVSVSIPISEESVRLP